MDWKYKQVNWYAALQVRAVGEDGARLVMHARGLTGGDPITRAPKRYYCHGPRGVTDWHASEDGAIADYESLGS